MLCSFHSNINMLNSFHSNIKFTIETEKGNKIAFLDILLLLQRFNQYYCVSQENETDLNINWKSFSPNNWKWEHLKPYFQGRMIYVQLKNTLKKS